MRRRTQGHRNGMIITAPLALLLAACGTAATSNPILGSTPTSTPSPSSAATPSPSAISTPAPETPLAVLTATTGQGYEVVNAQRVEQWGLTTAKLAQIFGVTVTQILHVDDEELWPVDPIQVEVAGPNFVLFYGAATLTRRWLSFRTLEHLLVPLLSRTTTSMAAFTSPPPMGSNGLGVSINPRQINSITLDLERHTGITAL